ncbi:hypothetical protein L211DRAFT_853404 [Terfezia boudieri ATCC MYA-4762]|uniref:Uncharacterized protein n=1 Tax=Terfezia boudieri ATCC MYA-4762 TaxID=1051890 RepID=A0A3N4L8J3_9PEZI|nr:hypothetical protein L211DRAFT_853404 [Terfezia boudieri ATCC MYA-4762]
MPPKEGKTNNRRIEVWSRRIATRNVKIRVYWNLVDPMESEDDTTTRDAVLVAQSGLGEKETIKGDARNTWAIEQPRTRRSISIILLERRSRCNISLFALERQFKHDFRIAKTEARVQALNSYTQGQKAYTQSVKVNIKIMEDCAGRWTISLDADYIVGDGGDVVVDVQLDRYSGQGGRLTVCIFEGVPPSVMQWLRHRDTIDLLNKHAPVISSYREIRSKKFYNRLTEYINLWYYNEKFVGGWRAYKSFLDCIQDGVTTAEFKDSVAADDNECYLEDDMWLELSE